MGKRTGKILLSLGVTPNLKGFKYINRAVEIAIEGTDSVCEGIYGKIAKEETHGNQTETAQRVEKVIRHAITHVNKEKWHEIGGAGLKNSEFIYTLALLVKKESD